jgi:hypothetical protein
MTDDADKKIKGRFLSFAVDPEIAARIKKVAKADGLSASSWVRSLIIRTFARIDEATKKDVAP